MLRGGTNEFRSATGGEKYFTRQGPWLVCDVTWHAVCGMFAYLAAVPHDLPEIFTLAVLIIGYRFRLAGGVD